MAAPASGFFVVIHQQRPSVAYIQGKTVEAEDHSRWTVVYGDQTQSSNSRSSREMYFEPFTPNGSLTVHVQGEDASPGRISKHLEPFHFDLTVKLPKILPPIGSSIQNIQSLDGGWMGELEITSLASRSRRDARDFGRPMEFMSLQEDATATAARAMALTKKFNVDAADLDLETMHRCLSISRFLVEHLDAQIRLRDMAITVASVEAEESSVRPGPTFSGTSLTAKARELEHLAKKMAGNASKVKWDAQATYKPWKVCLPGYGYELIKKILREVDFTEVCAREILMSLMGDHPKAESLAIVFLCLLRLPIAHGFPMQFRQTLMRSAMDAFVQVCNQGAASVASLAVRFWAEVALQSEIDVSDSDREKDPASELH